MLRGLKIIVFLSLAGFLFSNPTFSQDVGVPDTCKVEELVIVRPNSHFGLQITAFNDEVLGAFAIPLNFSAPPMDITCDSFSFAGSRTVNPDYYGLTVDTSNYSLVLYAFWMSGNLPIGDGLIATLYFSTGPDWDSTQGFVVDTVLWPPVTSLEFTNGETGYGFIPIFKNGSLGPYIKIISPNGGEIWSGGEIHEIKWTSSLSETENVKIEYSTNQGGTWLTVVDTTPNDESYFWTIPSSYSTDCLVKVSEVSDGTPWDISYSNFTILLFTMYAYPQLEVIDIGGGSADYIVKVNSAGYNQPVTLSLSGLPPDANYNFSLNPIIPPDSSILTVNTTSNTPAGTYLMTLRAQGDGQIVDSQLILVVNQAPEHFNLSSPENGDTLKSKYALVGWEKANDPDPNDIITYTVYYSSDSSFILQDSVKTIYTSALLSSLNDTTFYFWKVKAVDKWGLFSWCNQPFWSFYFIPLLSRGDVNADSKLNVTDAIYLINYLFKGGPPPVSMEQGDTNCDSKITVTDVIYLINYLFKGGPPPAC
jgi:hypothetical protein